MIGPYDDIIDHPHHVSKTHPQQAMDKRAAQFSPFAALTGYDDAVEETARYTDAKLELEEEDIAKINAVHVSLQKRIKECPMVHIEYFVPDPLKKGGKYVSEDATVRKIDDYNKHLILTSGKAVPFEDVFTITAI